MKNTKGQTILLIEDNTGDIRLIKEMLAEITSSDYHLISAETLKDGYEQIKNNDLILILLDLNLPDSSGKRTFDTVLKCAEGIPIVLVSGLQDEELSLSLIKEGAQDYIVKNDLDSRLLDKTIQYALIRKQAEEKLRESELSLNEAQRIGNIGSWEHDFITQKAKWSENCFRLYGYKPYEFEPTFEHFKKQVHPDDWHTVEESFESINKNMTPETSEIRIIRPDGTIKWFKNNMVPVFKADKLVTLKGTNIDITEQKLGEEKLQESEEKYRNLVDNSLAGVYKISLDGELLYFNKAMQNMFEFNGNDFTEFNITKLYKNLSERNELIRTVKEKGEVRNFETEFITYKGNTINVILNSRFEGGILTGIMTDITELKKMEKEILLAKNKAEEMNRLKSSFLANMSHEIRTPLNGILGFAQLLELEVKDDEQLKCVKIIEKSGNRLLETLDLILNFSKLEAEQLSAQYSEVDISNVINEVIDNFEAVAKKKNLFVERDINYEHLFAKIDERFFRHVLTNLIKNAVVYTNKGGITVTFDKDEKDMTIKVKDTGIGITREFYEVIFEPFRQESEGWGRNFEGTGLGLSITKRFVELMKGKIEVESEFGVGSTFTVRLPFTEPDATKEVKTKEKESAKKAIGELIQEKKELSILLVEDDEVNLLYTLTVLNKHYKTEFAKDGYSAIEAAKKKKYDIILMDINLGKEIDGIMATQEIRKMKGYENTPIVALTAYVREGDKEEFLAGGCTHFLGKPFTVKQLLELVEQLQ